MSDTSHDRLNGEQFCDGLRVVASIVIDQVVDTNSINQITFCGQLYVANCKDKGNTLKPYLSEQKIVEVLKALMLNMHRCRA